MWIVDDLIVAPATVRAGGGRGIVRLAGPGLTDLLERLLEPAAEPDGRAGRAVAALLREIPLNDASPVDAAPVDAAPVDGTPVDGTPVDGTPVDGTTFGPIPLRLLTWPDGRGPLGMASAELHLPGSIPLVDAVVARCLQLGARLARGGEFSLRAFLGGRLDLMQAEAVLAVVEAATPDDLSAALDRLSGGLGRALEAERERLLDIAADLEAMIDFGDEAIDPAAREGFGRTLAGRLETARSAIGDLLERLGDRAATATDGVRVVLSGPPNIGKSSLYNALLGRTAALVSDETGTTRDYLEAVVAGANSPVEYVLVDVAGLDGIVADGDGSCAGVVGRADAVARRQAARADVLVRCRDATAGDSFPPAGRARRIDVLTRCDRAGMAGVAPASGPPVEGGGGVIRTSSVTGMGIDRLRRAIEEAVARSRSGTPATLRAAEGLLEAHEALGRSVMAAACRSSGRPESGPTVLPTEESAFDEAVVASHLGRAIQSLASVTGREIGADLLDRIFSRHCIGK
jgi:tRNA modification GTPase